MEQLINPIRREKEYKNLLDEAVAQSRSQKKYPILLTGLSDGAKCAFYLAVSSDYRKKRGGKTLIIVPDESSGYLCEKVFNECGLKTAVYPYRDFNFSRVSASHSYEHERLAFLDKVLDDKADIYISTPDAALQYTVPSKILEKRSVTLETGAEIAFDACLVGIRLSQLHRQPPTHLVIVLVSRGKRAARSLKNAVDRGAVVVIRAHRPDRVSVGREGLFGIGTASRIDEDGISV